jgi:sugar (pentulose or hexulose) kinase
MSVFPGDPSDIVGVGLCTIRFCRALLDGDGRLTEPMLSWMDDRVSRPHVHDDRVVSVTTSSGYITHRLTGERRDAAGNHQGVWPIDQETWRWSDDPRRFIETGMSRELLFDLVDPGAELGRVTPEASLTTGLPVGVPVFATSNDKAVEALGVGVRGEADLVLSLGTYIAAMTGGSEAIAHDDGYWVNFGCEPGLYLYESGGIRRGMWTVSWWRDLLAGDGVLTDDELNTGAASVAAGSDGLVTLLDWLAPGDASYRRGALLGFDGRQGRFHVYRSIIEGIALTMRGHVEEMEKALNRRFERVTVSGGGSRSDLMMQILADVFDRPTVRAEVADAAGMGSAICAMVGARVHDWTSAVSAMVAEDARFEPSPAEVTVYTDLARRYAGVRAFSDPLFRHLAGDSL